MSIWCAYRVNEIEKRTAAFYLFLTSCHWLLVQLGLRISVTLVINFQTLRHFKWATPSEFGTYRLCEQRRFRRACASAQSRQNLRCSLIQAVNQEEPSDRKPDPWPRWMAGHAQLKCVMTECSKTQIRLSRPKCINGFNTIRKSYRINTFQIYNLQMHMLHSMNFVFIHVLFLSLHFSFFPTNPWPWWHCHKHPQYPFL